MAETLDELLTRTLKTALRESLYDSRLAIASAIKDTGIGTDQPSPTCAAVSSAPPRARLPDADIEAACEVAPKDQRELLLDIAAGPDEGLAVRRAKMPRRFAP